MLPDTGNSTARFDVTVRPSDKRDIGMEFLPLREQLVVQGK
jgi:hypothetical protein